MDELDAILIVTNQHIEGGPPCTRTSPGRYVSYFENALEEQWLFQYERGADDFLLTGGDIGWEIMGKNEINRLVLSTDERTWLTACFLACGLLPAPNVATDSTMDVDLLARAKAFIERRCI